MTRDEILNMPAGREMDVLVGVCVLDKTQEEINKGLDAGHNQYSTDISAAWEVLEKMRADCGGGGEPDYIMLNCYKELTPSWYCAKIWAHHDGDIPEVEVTAETAALAICRAALLAIGGNE